MPLLSCILRFRALPGLLTRIQPGCCAGFGLRLPHYLDVA